MEAMQAYQANGSTGADRPEPLQVHLSVRERRGLAWLRLWSRGQITRWKVARKYRPHEAVMDPREMATFQALFDLESAANELLKERK